MTRTKAPVTTRFYQVWAPGPYREWGRFWLTSDGCLSILSDFGNYGYWWGSPGCEFRRFLTRAGVEYIANKLAGGEEDYDGRETVKLVKASILELRRAGRYTREWARDEWDRIKLYDLDESYDEWFRNTRIPDAHELSPVYVTPFQLQAFMRKLWPVFVEALKNELLRERAREWFRRAA
ncbi:MAG TPA: hypothetical protein VGK73_33345 [Polyangiaceae bacterium]